MVLLLRKFSDNKTLVLFSVVLFLWHMGCYSDDRSSVCYSDDRSSVCYSDDRSSVCYSDDRSSVCYSDDRSSVCDRRIRIRATTGL